MAQAQNARRTSSKLKFVATVTPATIEKGDTESGIRYSVMKGATVQKSRGAAMVRTVMAFGRQNAKIARSLKPGKPIELVCVHDGGSIRVVGRPEKKEAAAA